MADKTALKAAGCPDEHCDQAAALGLTPDNVKKLVAAGFDFSKLAALVQLVMTMLPQIIALFGKVPA